MDEFLADPASRQITHLVLREGHLWSQKDVVVPTQRSTAPEKTWST